MEKKDLKIITEIMDLASKEFPVVKVENGIAYATNGQAMVSRPTEILDNGYFDLLDKDILKVIAKNGGDSNSLIHQTTDINFPNVDILEKAFNSKFQFEININGDNLIKLLKSLKGKDNKITIKIKDSDSPILISHSNGQGLIAPIV